ncbi:tail fiber domain-containing protein [Marisediminicola sp. LYQ134]|uniref:tail fiber domain-containing protein n=1 Tax=Marisediminicola sp. LYQ134 TaxID=3391061 RepID=UPI003982FCE7
MGSRTPEGDGLAKLLKLVADHGRRLSTLESPTGTSVRSLVDQVKNALANITTTVIAAISELSYTKAEINARIASTPGSVDVNGQLAVEDDLTVFGGIDSAGTIRSDASMIADGNVSAGGNVTSGGNVTAPGEGAFTSGIKSIGARNFVAGTDRAGAWLQGDGQLGIAPSSRRFKTDIDTWAPTDIDRLLSLRAVMFRYDPEKFPNQEIDPAAPMEVGFIAEELVDAGFPEFVFFRDGEVQGINYDRLVVALLELARWQQVEVARQHTNHEDRLKKLEAAIIRVRI